MPFTERWNGLKSFCEAFRRNEDGAAAIEYVMIAASIALSMIVSMNQLGGGPAAWREGTTGTS